MSSGSVPILALVSQIGGPKAQNSTWSFLHTQKGTIGCPPLHKGRMWASMFCISKDSRKKKRRKYRLETQVPLLDATANLYMVIYKG